MQAERQHQYDSAADMRRFVELYHEAGQRGAQQFGAGVSVLSYRDPLRHIEMSKPKLYNQKFRPGHTQRMIDAARNLSPHQNVYLSNALVNANLPTNERGTESDVVCVLSLVGDGDTDQGNAVKPIEGIDPTFDLQTSTTGGAANSQPHYIFSRPLAPVEAKRLAHLYSRKCGGDANGKVITSIWRVAGTLNHPDADKIEKRGRSPVPQLVKIVGGTGKTIDPKALFAALEAMPDLPLMGGTGGGTPPVEWSKGGEGDNAAIMAKIPPDVQRKMKQPNNGKDVDRSKHSAHVMLELFEYGLTCDEICSVSAGMPFAHKFFERGDLDREIARIHGKWIADGRHLKHSNVVQLPGLTPASQNEAINPVLYRCAADVQAERVEWLWRDRMAIAKSSLIGGNPGLGKSQITSYAAAVVSRGGTFCDGTPCGKVGSTVFLSAEDDAADTIKPRLMAAGADVSKIFFLDAIREKKDSRILERQFNLQADIEKLAWLVETENARGANVRMVVIDPISAYLGGADTKSNERVREVMGPLQRFAEKHRVAVVWVTHMKKSGEGEAINQFISSIAFAGAARSAWAVTKERDEGGVETGRCLVISVKSNLTPNVGGLAYRVEERYVSDGDRTDIRTSAIEWDEERILMTADEALAQPLPEGGRTGKNQRKEKIKSREVENAEKYLQSTLIDGPVSASEIKQGAIANLISEHCLKKAKNNLDIDAIKNGMNDGWSWSLPAIPSPEGDEVSPSTENDIPFEEDASPSGGDRTLFGRCASSSLKRQVSKKQRKGCDSGFSLSNSGE